ncbi:helix-turn-helix transcriptional regulator [bacterium]|nr:helix-turn-helix transcriptional regulator [bacterium]
MNDIIKLETITDLHKAINFGKPKHPLLTVVDLSKADFNKDYLSKRVVTSFYSVFLKDSCSNRVIYGGTTLDFEEGTMRYIAPNQSIIIEKEEIDFETKGWALFFHPDLIVGNQLQKKMDSYSFFSYDITEALHISDKERSILERIIAEIDNELSSNIDEFSQELIITNIELLLNYSKRFYGRQFITRKNFNKSFIDDFNSFLNSRVDLDSIKKFGAPTTKELADKMALSQNYLSDLLKKESGKTLKESINLALINKAKELLATSNKTVNEISYDLGFEYPEYFSKLFKKKTGVPPKDFRFGIVSE